MAAEKITWNGETHTWAEWAKIVKIHDSTLRRRYKRGLPMEAVLKGPRVRPKRKKPKKAAPGDPQETGTLCWECAHADKGNLSDCPWARDYIPVPGWSATETVLKGGSSRLDRPDLQRKLQSYFVTECPLFRRG